MIEIYCGDYFAKDGRKIPYVMEIGERLFSVKYDDGAGQKQKIMKARAFENGNVKWRLNMRSITYQSPSQLRHLFEEFDAYASATFRHITGIR